MIAFLAWAISLTLVSVAALWKGGAAERFAASVYYGSWIATVLFHNPNGYAMQWAIFAVDTLTFVLLAWLALRSDKYWPIFLAGFTLLPVITHAGRIIDKQMGAWAYFTTAQIWGYLAIFTLAYGTWSAWRRRRQMATAAAPRPDPGATLR